MACSMIKVLWKVPAEGTINYDWGKSGNVLQKIKYWTNTWEVYRIFTGGEKRKKLEGNISE